jgi:hypothetical protein
MMTVYAVVMLGAVVMHLAVSAGKTKDRRSDSGFRPSHPEPVRIPVRARRRY